MELALEGGDNFLIDDPLWAIDFAPNGMHPFIKINGQLLNL
jgi:hypothetical protein